MVRQDRSYCAPTSLCPPLPLPPFLPPSLSLSLSLSLSPSLPPSLPPSYILTDAIAPRSTAKGGASVVPVMEGDSSKLEEAVSKGEGRATLRLKKDGQAVVEEVVNYVYIIMM